MQNDVVRYILCISKFVHYIVLTHKNNVTVLMSSNPHCTASNSLPTHQPLEDDITTYNIVVCTKTEWFSRTSKCLVQLEKNVYSL
jgi:hypothetical protein